MGAVRGGKDKQNNELAGKDGQLARVLNHGNTPWPSGQRKKRAANDGFAKNIEVGFGVRGLEDRERVADRAEAGS